MCRWLAYTGSPILLEDLLVRPSHSLVEQSFAARQLYLPRTHDASQFRDHAFPTNGDGFGVGWWGEREQPGRFRDARPAWSDHNLVDLAAQIRSRMFLAHIREAIGGTVDQVNCHPFRHGRWLFQHNGSVGGFARIKRELTMDVAPELYPFLLGNADTEVCFYLALTYGLDTDPLGALSRMVGRIEAARVSAGIDEPLIGTFCAADGETVYAVRYSSDRNSHTLYHSDGPMTLTAATPGEKIPLPADGRILVSEPLELEYRDTHWTEVPEWSTVTMRPGTDPVIADFTPTAP